jgi:3,4-dihydroxy-9,10-secoandrosta-1,3,5(10)-triene-9,17-dione 4,5-dioxygenase
MAVCSLGYVVIETRDLSAWTEFATEILGLMPAPSPGAGVALFRMDARPFRFWLQEGEREAFVMPGWELADRADFEETIAKLVEGGVEVERGSPEDAKLRKVYDLARCSDPAGNRIELYYGRFLDYEPFVSPAGVSRFITGENGSMGLGHVVLPALPFDETAAFYKTYLGFGDTDLGRFYLQGTPDDPGLRFAFMHCGNPRHHSLALGEMPAAAGAVHMMIEAAEIDDVGRALDRVTKRNIPLSATLGRHVNDKMFSFYVKTPGGFDLEFGCHGVQIDWSTWTPTTSLPVSAWGHAFVPPVKD